jgi:hypothetical protein
MSVHVNIKGDLLRWTHPLRVELSDLMIRRNAADGKSLNWATAVAENAARASALNLMTLVYLLGVAAGTVVGSRKITARDG